MKFPATMVRVRHWLAISVLAALAGCGSNGSVSVQPVSIPLGTYLAANTSTGGSVPLVAFPTSASTTCLGLFDSQLKLTSAASLVEIRRYLNPPAFSNGVFLVTVVADNAEVAAYSTDGTGTVIIQRALSADTATFSHEGGRDILRVRELFNAQATCADPARVTVTYVRQ